MRPPLAAALLAGASAGIVFDQHTDQEAATVFEHACRFGFEGIVSKRLTAPYRSGPSRDWLKTKNPDSPATRRTLPTGAALFGGDNSWSVRP